MVAEIFVKQLDGCAYHSGGDNCNCAAEAMWLYRASQGAIRLSACDVRRETHDDSGGTRLDQVQAVSIAHGVPGGRLYKPEKFDTIENLIRTGRYGAIIQLDYSPLVGTKFDCFEGNFREGHSVYCSRGTSTTVRYADPGADHRRAGIPNGYMDMPWPLMKRAAGLLDLGNGETLNSERGAGYVYAYVTPADPVFPAQVWDVSMDGFVQLYFKPGGAHAGAVSRASYRCTRAKVDGLWWYHILSKLNGGKTANAGRYFKPNRYVEAHIHA